MDKYLNKKFRLKSSDKFEDYLKFIGIGILSRKMACSVTPIVYLVQNEDGSYTFTMTTTLRTVITKFKLDEEFVEERPDGFKVRTMFTFENGKLIQTQTENNDRKSTYVRELIDDTLIVKTTVEGWPHTCIRVYELID